MQRPEAECEGKTGWAVKKQQTDGMSHRGQGCIGREGTSEAAPEMVKQRLGAGTVGYKCH